MKIKGECYYLWRAVDQEGEVLEAYVSKKRNKREALKFLKKLMRRYGKPYKIVTDRLALYRAALRDLSMVYCKMLGDIRAIEQRILTLFSEGENVR